MYSSDAKACVALLPWRSEEMGGLLNDLGMLGFNRRHLLPMGPGKVYARMCFNLASIYRWVLNSTRMLHTLGEAVKLLAAGFQGLRPGRPGSFGLAVTCARAVPDMQCAGVQWRCGGAEAAEEHHAPAGGRGPQRHLQLTA